jgi:cobalt-zinc-cadmium efflux system outer membrane protein
MAPRRGLVIPAARVALMLVASVMVVPIAARADDAAGASTSAGTLRASDATLPPETVTIADVLQALREQSPRLRAEFPQIDAARADLVTARLLPNPTVDYQNGTLVGGTNLNGAVQHQATLAVPLPITGQRAAHVAAAEKNVEVAEKRVRARYAELALEARKLFVTLLAAEERERVLEEAHRDVEHLREIVAGRTSAGMAREYDSLRVATEAELVEAKASGARAEALDKSGELGRLLGLPSWHPRALGELRPMGAKVEAVADSRVMEKSQPALAVARSEEAAATAAVEVARRERWPLPVLSVGAVETRGASSTSFVGGLSVEVPLFDSGQGKIARSLAEADAATAARRATVAEAEAELGRARRLLKDRRAALAAFDREVVERLPTLRRMAEDAYRSGQGGVVELLDATQARTEAELAGIELAASVVQAEVDVLGAVGVVDSVLP